MSEAVAHVTSSETVRGADFAERKFRLFSSDGSRYFDCRFDGAVIGHASFGAGRRDSLYVGCSFDRSRLRMVGGLARFDRCTFRDATIIDWQGQRTELIDCVFSGRITRGVFFGRIPDSLVVHRGRKSNEVRGNDFSAAELIDCSFRGGIDLRDQRLPSGDNYTYVSDLRAAVLAARARVERVPLPERRRDMLILLEMLEMTSGEGQVQALLREKDYDGPLRLAFRELLQLMAGSASG